MDPQEDLIDRDITLTVLLPGGQEATATVHGSKPVMDVLVTLCAQHHLIPSDHAIKLISTNQNHVNFKPNSMIGSLEFERVVLQTKGCDNKKKPHVPVATVRLLVNYKKSHKAVARVNPTVPLAELMPTVCEKCEFDPDATILLRTYQSEEPLDLTKTLNDYGIRELYAKEIKVVPNNPADPVLTQGGEEERKSSVKEKNHREKGNKGFFGLFKKNKKTPEQAVIGSAPNSPERNGQCADRVNGVNGHSTLPMVPADMPKKRRAPRPPMMASLSVACGHHTRDFYDLLERDSARKQGQLSRISSTESSLKRTKRRAPPPPCDGHTPSDSDNKVEDAQGDDKSSDKYRARIADHCPAIAKVMSELAESLQARQRRTLSSANSSISQHQLAEDSSTDLFSEHHTPEAELKALSGCQLLRNPSEREGLTTFTVVPQRCQQSRQCFEVPLTLQTPDTAKADQELCPGDPDALEIPTTELLEAVPTEPFINGCKGSDKSKHLPEVLRLQPVEQENQIWTDVESENLELENEEDQYIYPEDMELESSESPLRGLGNLEHLGSTMNNLELKGNWVYPSQPVDKLADRSTIDPKSGPVEQEEMEEHALVETGEEKDWVEEYKERRRKFLVGDNGGLKKFDVWGRIQREFTNNQEERTMQEMDFPSPPPPVYCDDNNGENKQDEENWSKQEIPIYDEDLDQYANLDSKPKYASYLHYSKPKSHSTQTDPNVSSAENICSSNPEPQRTSFLSKSHSSFDPCPPASVSLFALAVFQKAKRSKPGLDPNCSRRRELPMNTHSN
ncbi:cordon-bleu protein-like 1 [Onychostoma macrolepis]|uniref:RBD domain-containing protein n=1 Tax=Onychostoma macrolepis TaxID=369639 RepID=A0A7J6CXF6_9TELE|nr:cordon-bleu protein-like 1 [Onychostoma macrolepis]XP_058633755.1 cordon-bleu protein-like 1 [Onychostoma macrolepis]XP_058633756.1 cordon-bleu protein-like 1 [Onychostoma macrolepis]XP_058633757.1 cordon-bleu protein-like 1 [Onychostoma macrolepis]XP_058633758.1 cordon-bleu protein-like 1 [Onychostoma macrolepis]XP_058633759.1 cordon-bleu protein-like 1 [Onychostoma macrolepis]XP_058633761.1 cordon-bleu protein-like 1 [Onychostoma macrolepis]XP_058633762.1 cordon-bleu protein-like 1 [Ony